jgi:hypothetical protein
MTRSDRLITVMAPILLVHRLRLARPRRAPALVIIRVHRIAEAEPVLASPSSPCASSLSTFYRGTSPWKIEARLPLEHPLSGSARGRGPGPGGLWHAKHCWARPCSYRYSSLDGNCGGRWLASVRAKVQAHLDQTSHASLDEVGKLLASTPSRN